MTKVQLLSLGAFLAAGSLFGQISITSNAMTVVSFDASQAGVLRLDGSPTGAVAVGEPNAWSRQGSSPAFTLWSEGVEINGQSNSFATPFTTDYNNNGNIDDNLNFFNHDVVTSATGPAALVGNGIRFNEDQWADRYFTFKFVNNSGSTTLGATIVADLWSQDDNINIATVAVQYSTSPTSGFVTLDSLVGTNGNTQAWTYKGVNESVAVTLAPGDDLYVKILYTQMGQGNAFVFDNVGVQIPEPSTYAALAGALALGLVAYRRRR